MISATDETFDKELAVEQPVLVKFGAPWCSPCLGLQPVLEELATEYKDKMKFLSVDIDSTTIASRFGIRGIPTILIFKNSEVVNTIVGGQQKSRYQLAIDTVLA